MTAMYDITAPFYACCAQRFCVDFGVYRGEAIARIDELNLGDTYHLKSDTDWIEVAVIDKSASAFERSIAANVPVETLTTLAHLIFMTTTGRRADVFLSISNGHLYLTCETQLVSNAEYVLIHVEKRDVAFTPVVVPTPVPPALPAASENTNVIPMRLLG